MMRCDNADLLLAYAARRLDAETAALLRKHMQTCAECRAFGESQRELWSALDLWEAIPVPADFDRKLYRRIEQEERTGFWGRFVRPWLPVNLRPALPLAVASAIVMVALMVQSPTSVPPQAQAEAVDAEQVERAFDDLDMLKQLPLLPRVEAGSSQAM